MSVNLASSLTDEQMEMRKHGIGSSEIAAVAGLHPYRSALDVYAEKVGIAPPFKGNRKTQIGTFLEPAIALHYAEEFRCLLSSPGTLTHPEHRFALATPDRFRMDNGKPTRIVEIKWTDDDTQWGPARTARAPDHVVLQTVWQMAVTGVHAADIVVLKDGDIHTIPVEWNPEQATLLLEIGRRFWFEHVLRRSPPKVSLESPEADEYLKIAYPPESANGAMLMATPEVNALVASLRAARASEEAAAKAEKAAQRELKALIGDADGIAGSGWTIRYKWTNPSPVVDWEAVAKELNPSDEVIKRHTAPGAKSRPFNFDCKEQ